MRQHLIDTGDSVVVSRSLTLRKDNVEATVLGVRGIRARVQYLNGEEEVLPYSCLTKIYSSQMKNIASFFAALAETIQRIECGEWDKETIEPCRLENLSEYASFRIHPMYEDEHSGYIRHKPGHRNALRIEPFGGFPWEKVRCDLLPKNWQAVKIRNNAHENDWSLRSVYDEFGRCIEPSRTAKPSCACKDCPVAKLHYSVHGTPNGIIGK